MEDLGLMMNAPIIKGQDVKFIGQNRRRGTELYVTCKYFPVSLSLSLPLPTAPLCLPGKPKSTLPFPTQEQWDDKLREPAFTPLQRLANRQSDAHPHLPGRMGFPYAADMNSMHGSYF